MLVPRGITNLTMEGRHLSFMPHSMVTGIVAALEDVPKPMAKAGKYALHRQASAHDAMTECVDAQEGTRAADRKS